MSAVASLPSIGAIARELGVQVHQVRYALVSRGIKPVAKAGNSHVYDPQAIEELRQVFSERGIRGNRD